jgi:putative MATE family efflux protein
MPAIIGMVVNALYNIVDRIYVGQGIDALAIAAITIIMPVMMVIMAASILIGVGANALFSIRLGQRRRGEVEKIMGHAFVLLFLIPAAAIALSFIFIDDILIKVLGASPAVFPYAKTYLKIILYGAIFAAAGPGINHFIRSDGHPKTSMFTQILGAAVNIILDPLFIFVFGWGIAGAAWATVISQFISFLWVVLYFNSRWTKLRFRLKYMKLEPGLTLKITALGFAPFALQMAIGLVNALLNHSLLLYGGDIAVAAIGIVYSILIVIFMPIQGLTQGAQPIIGYNYGAKQYERVKRTFVLAVTYATISMTAGFILMEAFPGFFISIFRNEQGQLMDLGIRSLRICTIMFPVVGFQIIASNFFQALGKPLQGTLLSLSRQIIFFIPLLLILPKIFGLQGILFAFPAADLGAASLSAIFVYREFKRMNATRAK